jgi:hypothetical protein
MTVQIDTYPLHGFPDSAHFPTVRNGTEWVPSQNHDGYTGMGISVWGGALTNEHGSVVRLKKGVLSTAAESAGGSREKGNAVAVESVADILDSELQAVIQDWLYRVHQEPDLMMIPLNFEERTGHLPQLLHDVISRLRLDAGTKAPISEAASVHGDLRRKQGYTVAMAVEESRLLQVSIFTMLHKNVKDLEFSALLPNVVTIADEVDAQLKQQMLRFMAADAIAKVKET